MANDNVQQYLGYAVLIIIVVITLALGARVLQKTATSGQDVVATIELDLKSIATTPVKLRPYLDNDTISLINVSTDANNDTIPAGDYQVDSDGGYITVINSTDWGPNVYANYSFHNTAFWNATYVQGAQAVTELSSWLGTIALVLAAVTIIGVVAFLAARSRW